LTSRTLIAALVLGSGAASAHAVSFDFVSPAGAGNRTDAGLFVFTWTDGPDAPGQTTARIFLSRPSLLPWGKPDGGVEVEVTAAPFAIADPDNTFVWPSAGAAAGCYQPWVRMTDPMEGASVVPARGLVTVLGGANVPPSVWITTPANAVLSDAGRLEVQFDVDDPDDMTFVTLEARTAESAAVRLATDLPLSLGGGSGSFVVDTALLDAGVWYLHVVVREGDAGTCDAWWPGTLYLQRGADGGSADAGRLDAGVRDAGGSNDAGTGGGGGGTAPPQPCGCQAGGPGLALLALLTLARGRCTGRSLRSSTT
jgi:hypothetical protein